MFSKELEQSIANLFDQAQDQNLEYLTIEHLLLMLLSDFEVRQALETNDLNIATLKENLARFSFKVAIFRSFVSRACLTSKSERSIKSKCSIVRYSRF